MMEPNVGTTDRIARIVVGIGLLVGGGAIAAGYTPLSVAFGVLAFAVGVVLVGTGLARRCILNRMLGVDTT